MRDGGSATATAVAPLVDSLRQRITRGALWSLTGAVISQALALAASVITARYLGKEGFGEFGIIQSTIGMLGTLAGLGLSTTATKYVAQLRTTDPDRAGRIIALGSAIALSSGSLLSAASFLFAPLLAARTLNAPQLTMELRIASGLLVLNALNGTQTGI